MNYGRHYGIDDCEFQHIEFLGRFIRVNAKIMTFTTGGAGIIILKEVTYLWLVMNECIFSHWCSQKSRDL